MTLIEAGFGSIDYAACFALRWEVFVGEQKVPGDDEQDELDETARHFLLLVQGEPAATARAVVYAPGVVKIGRVAVRKPFRGTGLGAALMRRVEEAHPGASFVLDAQIQALKFYERLGYVSEGAEFLDAGIPHLRMVKLSAAR
jgi:predicted GNAT family N-acyltransferase